MPLVAELIPQYPEISMLISSLATINRQMGDEIKGEIFDGRVSRLAKLVKNKSVSLEKNSGRPSQRDCRKVFGRNQGGR